MTTKAIKTRSNIIPKGRKAAIDEFCKECIHDPGSGTGSWRQQVAACTAKACPLYTFRPLPLGEKH